MRFTFRNVACAISGGVDSAVSAYILKKKGFNVTGVFMKNWDSFDEYDECLADRDLASAKDVCHKIKIDLLNFDFTKEYWSGVFIPLLNAYEHGLTPNPDILCNRLIKFDLLYKRLIETKRFDAFATGHYAQNSFGNFLQLKPYHNSSNADLLRAIDPVKDQTFWLSTVNAKYLSYCMFPIGDMIKPNVKKLAAEIGLDNQAKRKESMGICFIGKRSFSDFIDQYIPAKHGLIKCIDSDQVLGEHRGVHHFTLGQRIPLIDKQGPFFVAKLDQTNQIVKVAKYTNNPHLFMRICSTYRSIWTHSSNIPKLPIDNLEFQWQNKWRAISCNIEASNRISEIENESFHDCQDRLGPSLNIILQMPLRCISPGQWAAFYQGNKCLGGAQIIYSKSIVESDNHKNFLVDWKAKDFEISYGN